MEPIFFGSSDRRLFGAYHPPVGVVHGAGHQPGVVLCYPGVQEYMRSHLAFRKLADILARAGLPVLRFDYFGTGDSAGEVEDATLDGWCADIQEAAAELRDLSLAPCVSLVGMGLGAALAAMVASHGFAVRDLVLWDPTVDGGVQVEEWRLIEKRKYAIFRHRPRVGRDELLGYVFSPSFQEEVERINLMQLPACSAELITIIGSRPKPEYTRLRARLSELHEAPIHLEIVPDESCSAVEATLLSTRILESIAARLGGRC